MRSFLILFAFCISVRADFVDTIAKCKLKDKNCLKDQLQILITEATTKGLPEYGIKPIDPLDLSGEKLKILDELFIDFDEASIEGLKYIVVKDYEIDVEKNIAKHEYEVSKLKFEANLTFSGNNELLKALFGSNSFDGYGHVLLNVENVKFHFSLPFKFVKKDGHIYFKMLPDGSNFKYKVGKVHLASDRLVFNNQDFSELVTSLVNENWKAFMNILDKRIFDLVVRNYVNIVESVYEKLPDDKLFEDNLELLIKE